MRGIKYVGPVGDFSGYGSAARNYVLSLHNAGIPVTVFPRNFDPSPPPIADPEERALLDSLVDRNIDYDVIIIHLTPDLYPRYAERGKYNIGYAAWETSLLHPKWVSACRVVQEMWVPCDCNVDAFKDSGITAPVYKIPHGMDPKMFNGVENSPYKIKGLDDSTFKFYSIFQWTNRKNPEGLIRAYFNAFDDSDDVVLILKAYRMGHPKDKEFIRNKIVEIKNDMNIGHYPKIILIGDLLSKKQILGLHVMGDCCVGLHRGEGWGLPLAEAGLAGNPVIGTAWGGNTEFMKPDNSYLVDYSMTWVSGMSDFTVWYLGNQQWAEPNIVEASKAMYHVYSHQKEAKERGAVLKDYISSEFSWESVSSIMIDRLKSI